jgi:leader peptidase (prepilin peptidase)/N-methyltransferase
MCIEQSIIDYATHRLPRGVTFRAAIIGGPLLTLAAINIDDNGRIGVMFASFIVTLVLFATLSALSKGGIGGGDVRLAPVLAMFLGWLGASNVYIGLGIGFIIGGVVAAGMLATRRASASTRIAFGPFLCIGAVIAALLI